MMEREILRGRTVLRAGLALFLLDGFTGRPVESGLCLVRPSEQIQILKKPGGCIVCLNPPETAFDLWIESPVYYPAAVHAEPGDGTCRTKSLRLIPGPNYPVPAGAVRAEGRAEPGSEVFFSCGFQDLGLRLLYDYKKEEGNRIFLYQDGRSSLEGRRLRLTAEKGKKEEWLLLGEAFSEDESAYLLERPLDQDYKKAGTSLFPVYEGRADQSGKYQVLIKDGQGPCVCINRTGDGREIRKEIVLDGKGSVRLDFTD